MKLTIGILMIVVFFIVMFIEDMRVHGFIETLKSFLIATGCSIFLIIGAYLIATSL